MKTRETGARTGQCCIRSRKHLLQAALVAVAMLIARSDVARAQYVRTEVHTLHSVTLTDRAFLAGKKKGTPVTLAGTLRLPLQGSERLPAVVLLHGSGGITEHIEGWIEEFNAMGIATFLVDSFTGRGITSTLTEHGQLSRLAMILDAYRALELMVRHPLIDPNRVALMGFSRGGQATLYAGVERFRRLHGPAADLDFAAYIAFYPLCNATYRNDDERVDRPIRIFQGKADDYNPVAYCRAYVDRLRAAGEDVALEEYDGAHHVFDWPLLAKPVHLAEAQTVRNCRLEEGRDGIIRNTETGRPFTYEDACVERGVTVAYRKQANDRARQAVKEFLGTVLEPRGIGASLNESGAK